MAEKSGGQKKAWPYAFDLEASRELEEIFRKNFGFQILWLSFSGSLVVQTWVRR